MSDILFLWETLLFTFQEVTAGYLVGILSLMR